MWKFRRGPWDIWRFTNEKWLADSKELQGYEVALTFPSERLGT